MVESDRDMASGLVKEIVDHLKLREPIQDNQSRIFEKFDPLAKIFSHSRSDSDKEEQIGGFLAEAVPLVVAVVSWADPVDVLSALSYARQRRPEADPAETVAAAMLIYLVERGVEVDPERWERVRQGLWKYPAGAKVR